MAEIAAGVLQGRQPLEIRPGGRDRLFNHGDVVGQHAGDARHQSQRRQRTHTALHFGFLDELLAGLLVRGGKRVGARFCLLDLRRRHHVFQQFAQLGQSDLRIADQADLDRIVFTQLPRVLIDVYDLDVLRYRACRLEIDV